NPVEQTTVANELVECLGPCRRAPRRTSRRALSPRQRPRSRRSIAPSDRTSCWPGRDRLARDGPPYCLLACRLNIGPVGAPMPIPTRGSSVDTPVRAPTSRRGKAIRDPTVRQGNAAARPPAEPMVRRLPLEGAGFEPSVPLLGKALLGVANRRRSHLQVQVR